MAVLPRAHIVTDRANKRTTTPGCDELARAQVAANRVRYRALHDGLTLLPNGGYFRERLERALCRREPPHQALAVLYLSLNLEALETSIDGHDSAGYLLKTIASRLFETARAEDMLCRLGGDEFACLVPGLPKRDDLSDFANKLLAVASAPVGSRHLCVRPSIGIAIYPRHGTSAEALIMNAEFSMHRAKLNDSGYAFVDER
jgi:diguanylate cyclase